MATDKENTTLETMIQDFEGIRDLLEQVNNRLVNKIEDLEGPGPEENCKSELNHTPPGKIARLRHVTEELGSVANSLEKVASYYEGL